MFRAKRYLIGFFVPVALMGLSISASEALGQKAKETFVYAPPTVTWQLINRRHACEGTQTPRSFVSCRRGFPRAEIPFFTTGPPPVQEAFDGTGPPFTGTSRGSDQLLQGIRQ